MTNTFLGALSSYPTVVFTVGLAVVLLYWLSVIIGFFDIDLIDIGGDVDIDLDLDVDADLDIGDAGAEGGGAGAGGIAGMLSVLGLKDIPITVILSFIILFSWTICCLANMWIIPPGKLTFLRFLAGLGVQLVSLTAAILLTSLFLRPLRRFFVSHTAVSKNKLVGSVCTVITSVVDEKFGRAEVRTKGPPINIQVWSEDPRAFAKGDRGMIIQYDRNADRYLIVPESEIRHIR